jgi:hypothetical protein
MTVPAEAGVAGVSSEEQGLRRKKGEWLASCKRGTSRTPPTCPGPQVPPFRWLLGSLSWDQEAAIWEWSLEMAVKEFRGKHCIICVSRWDPQMLSSPVSTPP